VALLSKVKKYLSEKLRLEKALHMTLIDPAKTGADEAGDICREAAKAGSSAIMVGGSIGVSERMVDEVVLSIKKSIDIPIILFPGNPSGVSKYADAVWFLSVLNSRNPFFIIGGQAQGAPVVKRYGIEALSLAYLILGEGGTVSYISQTEPIPLNKPEIVVAYSLAAEFFGFSFLYLEGGSGARPIPPEIINVVKRNVSIPLIVGGGIKDREIARKVVTAGADIVVTGTLVEKANDVYRAVREVICGIREGVKNRLSEKS